MPTLVYQTLLVHHWHPLMAMAYHHQPIDTAANFPAAARRGVCHAKRVNPLGRWFGRMAFTTGQPRFEPQGGQGSTARGRIVGQRMTDDE